MSDEQRVIETRGDDIEVAINNGLAQLGVNRDQVIVDIVDRGSAGILGLGRRDAVVRLTDVSGVLDTEVKEVVPDAVVEPEPTVAAVAEPAAVSAPPAPAAAPPSEKQAKPKKSKPPKRKPKQTQQKQEEAPAAEATDKPKAEQKRAAKPARPPAEPLTDEARAELEKELEMAASLVGQMLDKMGVSAEIESTISDADDLTGEYVPIVKVHGDDLGTLIGQRGKVLNGMQFLTRAMVSQQLRTKSSFVLDIGGYREKRNETLVELAERMADKVIKKGKPLTLNPMPPHERRIIHMALRDNSDVVTKSVGEGNRRRVRITRKGGGKSRRKKNAKQS